MDPSDGPPLPTSGAALRLARLFAPRWVVVRGCVVRDGAFHPGAIEEGWRATGGDRTAIEARLNRVVLREEVSDPDPEILHEVAVALAASWRATLREAFPARAFDVGITADGDEAPIVWAASRRM